MCMSAAVLFKKCCSYRKLTSQGTKIGQNFLLIVDMLPSWCAGALSHVISQSASWNTESQEGMSMISKHAGQPHFPVGFAYIKYKSFFLPAAITLISNIACQFYPCLQFNLFFALYCVMLHAFMIFCSLRVKTNIVNFLLQNPDCLP